MSIFHKIHAPTRVLSPLLLFFPENYCTDVSMTSLLEKGGKRQSELQKFLEPNYVF